MNPNKSILLKLETFYSSKSELTPQNDSTEDVPNVSDEEFKTTIPLVDEHKIDVREPIIQTKKGKNILRELPPDVDNPIDDIELFDKKGNEIELDDEDDIKDLDKSEPEEKVNDIDDDLLVEQNEEDDQNNLGDMAQSNMGEQNPSSGQDPNIDPNQMQPDPNSMMGGEDQGMMGDVDPSTGAPRLSAENVGRVYELKKIYSRLLAIESQLSFSSEETLLKLRKFITKAIELFETVISNIGSYRKNIDEIIIMYYNFLQKVYAIMSKYYKIQQEKDKKEIKQNKKNSVDDKEKSKQFINPIDQSKSL